MVISVGFAYLTTTLNINGSTLIRGNSWDVHFENITITDGSVTATSEPEIESETNTNIHYTVDLERPGDFYEFTVDVVNKGTIDAMVGEIPELLNDNNKLDNVLIYTVTYADGGKIDANDVLAAKTGKATYKVRVEYKNNINEDDLIDSNEQAKLEFSVNYAQADDSLISNEEGN